MKIGDKVFYASDDTYRGVILEIKQTLCKVIWFKDETIEWVPVYSLITEEISNEKR